MHCLVNTFSGADGSRKQIQSRRKLFFELLNRLTSNKHHCDQQNGNGCERDHHCKERVTRSKRNQTTKHHRQQADTQHSRRRIDAVPNEVTQSDKPIVKVVQTAVGLRRPHRKISQL